jgi:hypothetical protein
MIHYHGTPITPVERLYEIAGAFFCVSFIEPRDVKRCHDIGQGVMLDNGAFSAWTRGAATDWQGFYAWVDPWLDCATTWAVIPDVVEGSVEEQEELIRQWPHGTRGTPVWHMHEPIDRLLQLLDSWPRVCMGSSAQYADVLSDIWRRRMDESWNAIEKRHRRTPNIHMLRGMNCSGGRWPFASVDSSDIARHHSRAQNTPKKMKDRWDAMQTPVRWTPTATQLELIA